jgi:hemerythrin-like domain-containing protein
MFTMPNITSIMTEDHRDCDDAFVDFENMISQLNWVKLDRYWKEFSIKLNTHFEKEEKVLFPAFEEATGMTQGPTMVMRSEHKQMQQLMLEIEQSIGNQDSQQCQAISETLMMMMQQHNMKEEQMLYPMTDQHLQSEEVVASMQSV